MDSWIQEPQINNIDRLQTNDGWIGGKALCYIAVNCRSILHCSHLGKTGPRTSLDSHKKNTPAWRYGQIYDVQQLVTQSYSASELSNEAALWWLSQFEWWLTAEPPLQIITANQISLNASIGVIWQRLNSSKNQGIPEPLNDTEVDDNDKYQNECTRYYINDPTEEPQLSHTSPTIFGEKIRDFIKLPRIRLSAVLTFGWKVTLIRWRING